MIPVKASAKLRDVKKTVIRRRERREETGRMRSLGAVNGEWKGWRGNAQPGRITVETQPKQELIRRRQTAAKVP